MGLAEAEPPLLAGPGHRVGWVRKGLWTEFLSVGNQTWSLVHFEALPHSPHLLFPL